jgi:hypothetical protein
LKWLDKEGKEAGKGLVGETLKLEASCNGDMEEGAGVTFRVYKEGANPKRDEPEYEAGANNKGGKAEAEWYYEYRHDAENPLKEKPKFFFTVNAQRCKEAKSGNVEIGMNYRIQVKEERKEIANTSCEVSLSDGSTENAATDGNGFFELKEKVPGIVLGIKYTDAEESTRQNTKPFKSKEVHE